MATVASPADQAGGLLKKLPLDSQTKSLEVPEPTKKTSVEPVNVKVQPSNKSVTSSIPDLMDPSMAFYPNAYASAYYYGAYDGTNTDWEDYRYMSTDGVDLAHGLYGYGYSPYGPYSPAASPVPTVGQEGLFYGTQPYQYPSFFQPSTGTGASYPATTATAKGDNKAPSAADKSALTVDIAKGNSNGVGPKGTTNGAPMRSTPFQNSGYNGKGSYGKGAQNGYQDLSYGANGVYSPFTWFDASMYSDPKAKTGANNSYGNGVASKNQNAYSHSMTPRPVSGFNTASGYMNRMYPNNLYGQYGNTYRSSYGYDLQGNARGWLSVDNKYKNRGRNGFFGYNNENSDGLNELNRGPRARPIKNPKLLTPVTIAVKGQNLDLAAPTESVEKEVKDASLTPDREQYNKADFSETYENAKFFIIKSYSEDDVHKSIKYNVWASTQNGNKKLDAAYQEAQQKSEACPVFLFFSVNTSGQFVGVAEMIGSVDFNKSLEYWQQDKWIGCFPVKWHIVKDVPNSYLKLIILENNENKPVTNSRDTQEVKLEHGLQMIKIFKEHSSKQCILDDFEFYEDRQKKIQEKKAKQQQFQKQAWEGKPVAGEKNKDVTVDVVADLVKEIKLEENVQVDVANLEVMKVAANGVVANGC
ncbi:YTH domain-containing protein ECT4-like [Rutidosis leptorrhynchoides]|uniref:YTH domain-containing protein ECT4-like n=1 Tax=Rutidosis leptorrhynchoides TaxID=125765 RepID=UPI003A98EB9B